MIKSLETKFNNNAPPQICIAIPGSHWGSRTRGGKLIILYLFKSWYDPNIWSDPEYVCTLAKCSHYKSNIKNLQSGDGKRQRIDDSVSKKMAVRQVIQ